MPLSMGSTGKFKVDEPKSVTLGGSKLNVSSVCLGTMTFGTAACPEATAWSILDRYIELGGNFIDMSEVYPVPLDITKWADSVGSVEEIVGRWLAARPGLRSKIVLATKVTPSPVADLARAKASREKALTGNFDDGGSPTCDFSHDQILRACEASRKRLGVSHIDLYQLHWPERATVNIANAEVQYKQDQLEGLQGFEAIATTMEELIRTGAIKSWGVCNETTYGVCSFRAACNKLNVTPPVSIQNQFGLLYRLFEGSLAETCSPKHCNVSLLAYGVLNGGVLSGKYLDGGNANELSRYNIPTYVLQPFYKTPATADAVKEYMSLAAQYKMDAATLAVAWAQSRWYMGSVIVGANSVAQLDANWRASGVTLDEELLEKIDAIHMRRRNPNCTN